MEFNTEINGGHRGARKFWRNMLPRLKFRNPAIPMQISRHNDPDGPSLLHIYTRVPDTSAPTPTHTLEMRNLNEEEILEALVKTVGGTAIEPTEEEREQLRDLAARKEVSDKDRAEVREKLVKERREQELLRLARGEMASAA
ncbi:hypothetical protein ACEQ8H_003061 [Pleosporales sp. CAS-2024a]